MTCTTLKFEAFEWASEMDGDGWSDTHRIAVDYVPMMSCKNSMYKRMDWMNEDSCCLVWKILLYFFHCHLRSCFGFPERVLEVFCFCFCFCRFFKASRRCPSCVRPLRPLRIQVSRSWDHWRDEEGDHLPVGWFPAWELPGEGLQVDFMKLPGVDFFRRSDLFTADQRKNCRTKTNRWLSWHLFFLDQYDSSLRISSWLEKRRSF